MHSRRKFLQSSGIALLGMGVSQKFMNSFFIQPVNKSVGLQLYTLFSVIDKDVPGALKKVAGIGYKEIESAFSRKGGYYGMKPKEFAALVKDLGMSWKSHHVSGAPFRPRPSANPPAGLDGKPGSNPPMRNLRDNMQELVDEAAEAGISYLVCASTPINTLDEIKASLDILNKTDEACKKAGVGFAYHNHEREFRTVENQVPYELMLAQTKMKMELDLAWATKGGKDPVELFKQHPGRFPMWHVKDLDKEMKTVLPVGDGIIDFKRIFDNASLSGMQHFFVEHDMPADPFASITTSYSYITKLITA